MTKTTPPQIVGSSGAQSPSTALTIISGHIAGLAARVPAGSSRTITTLEIVTELADMADIELNDAAECMARLGYSVGMKDGKSGWVISPQMPLGQ